MIKCSCGATDCNTTLSIDTRTKVVNVNNNGRFASIYLDANTTVKLIKELKKLLLEFVEEEK